jgi:endonuclease/exonuclease/phosphatase family metal-dependent hydrolase
MSSASNEVSEEFQKANSLTFLSYNVWFDERRAVQRYKGMLSLIKAEQISAAFLQEVTPLFIKTFISSHLNKSWYLYTSPRSKTNYGVAYLSKVPLYNRRVLSLPSQYGRSVFFALIELRDSEYIVLANVHLESGAGEYAKRGEQISIIQKILLPEYIESISFGRHEVEILGVVWAGDFNIELDEKQPDLTDHWQDAAEVFDKVHVPTFNTKYRSVVNEFMGWLGGTAQASRLDRFYVSSTNNDIKLTSYNVLNARYNERYDLSDHFAIMTTLTTNE